MTMADSRGGLDRNLDGGRRGFLIGAGLLGLSSAVLGGCASRAPVAPRQPAAPVRPAPPVSHAGAAASAV
ncbi:MAG: hypothetical protein OJK14_08155, partial [Achromobacter sp.]|nr:hypothetical protein [Achromobacter sp.]